MAAKRAGPPGSGEGGPGTEPGRPHHHYLTAAERGQAAFTLTDPPADEAVAAKLWRLHWDYGYFTRAEIEAALGAGDAA
jgi:hypothetical protein